MRVETGVKDQPTASPKEYKHPEQIYILFNPWVKGAIKYVFCNFFVNFKLIGIVKLLFLQLEKILNQSEIVVNLTLLL